MPVKRGVRVVLFLTALAAAVVFAFPIFVMITSAFKAEEEIQSIPIHWLPHHFQWLARFREAAEFAPLGRYFANSSLYAVVHVVVTVFFGALAGFGFAKYRFPGRTFLFFFVISTIMIPFQILVVPAVRQIRRWCWGCWC